MHRKQPIVEGGLVAGLTFAVALAFGLPTQAQTPDGETPAVEDICSQWGMTGKVGGLCNAYCEAMDCDAGENAQASEQACERVLGKIVAALGDTPFPTCEDTDDDDVPNGIDNCPDVANADQTDSDGNGMGDACEAPGYAFASDYSGLAPCIHGDSIPLSRDWVAQGAVPPVRDAGTCGADWALAAIGAVESNCYIATGVLNGLSAQQIIDCDGRDGGCGNGSSPAAALQTIVDAGGACTETNYPYTSSEGLCEADSCDPQICAPTTICRVQSEGALRAAVSAGPVAVVISAGAWLDNYSSGIADPMDCGTRYEAALAVGYGVDPSDGPYFILKLGRGASSFDQGYVRLAEGACGIADFAVMPGGGLQ